MAQLRVSQLTQHAPRSRSPPSNTNTNTNTDTDTDTLTLALWLRDVLNPEAVAGGERPAPDSPQAAGNGALSTVTRFNVVAMARMHCRWVRCQSELENRTRIRVQVPSRALTN